MRSPNSLTNLLIPVIVTLTWFTKAQWTLPNHDNEWLLLVAERFLSGGQYYSEFLEPNSPIVILFNIPAVLLSHWIDIGAYRCYVLWVCLLAVVSTFLARPWLTRIAGRSGVDGIIVYLVLMLWPFGYAFGQREHIIVMLLAPSMLWLVCRQAGLGPTVPRVSLMVVAAAAVGVLIKPYYLLLPSFLFGWWMIRKRSLSLLIEPHVLVFLGVCIVYGVTLLLVFRQWFSVAELAIFFYGAYDTELSALIHGVLRYVFLGAIVLVAAELLPIEPPYRIWVRYSCYFAVIGIVAYLLQHKGWDYHLIVGRHFEIMAVFGLTMGLLKKVSDRRGRAIITAIIGIALSILIGLECARQYTQLLFSKSEIENPSKNTFQSICRELAAGREILILSTNLGSSFPLVSLIGAHLASRTPDQWLIPGIVRLEQRNGEPKATVERFKTLLSEMITDDIGRYKPDIITVRTGADQALPHPFDYIGFLEASSKFRSLWREYRLIRRIDGWDFYRYQPLPMHTNPEAR